MAYLVFDAVFEQLGITGVLEAPNPNLDLAKMLIEPTALTTELRPRIVSRQAVTDESIAEN